jgi:tRNA pseudouridine55 synthase
MYKRARAAAEKGETVTDVPMRTMKVYEAQLMESTKLELDNKNFQLVTVRFAVGSGTYIRSLGEELGNRLGYPATLYNLRRTKVGIYDVADAKTLEQMGGL